MRALIVLIFLMFTPLAAFAQTTAPSADASIDELISIIENDDTRAVLIERLRQTEAGVPTAPVEAPQDLSIARQLAEYTRAVAEGASATFRSLGQVVSDLQQGLSGTQNADITALANIGFGLLIVGAALFGSFLILRITVSWLEGYIGSRIVGRGWLLRIAGAIGGVVLDLGAVLLAWGIGYFVALAFVGDSPGRMGINQSLLLNAFMLVELTKMVVRAILAPRHEPLRLIPVSDSNAAYWQFWAARIISLVGYTFLFIAPVVSANLSPGIAAAIQVLVMATAVTIGIIIVLQNRDDVRNWLTEMAQTRGNNGYGQALILLGRYWHLVAIGYLLALLVVWFANPEQALPFMLGATLQSLIAIVVGVIIVGFIARFVGIGLRVPDDIKQRLPLLETRLQAFVPTVMQVVRWVVIVGVVVAIAQAWALFDFVGWISSDDGQAVAGSVISAILIILVCFAIHIAMSSWIEYRLNPNFGTAPTPREKTLLGLFRNAATIALVVFGVMLALAQIGVNIAPLLAGAGVIGLAIGFGAQKLVQDIITGIFIQFENVMNEGDVVAVGDKSGVVEKLTIRSVTIRDMSGTVHLIPFSSVDQVSNMVRGFSFYVAEFDVAYDSDIEQVKQVMRDAFEVVMASEHRDVIIDVLDPPALVSMTANQMKLRSRIKTLAGKQWGPGRLYSETVKRLLAERGIMAPSQTITYRSVDGRRLPPPDDMSESE
ncbi:mechanosensitive ion channel domain-containing protein [Devosia sp. 2618]|uniref:mechanosensitive ion channel domain-containing protein n=1 Tax=Devosia sp. 2618 TaxID=3156454 RepID=UPI00339744AC